MGTLEPFAWTAAPSPAGAVLSRQGCHLQPHFQSPEKQTQTGQILSLETQWETQSRKEPNSSNWAIVHRGTNQGSTNQDFLSWLLCSLGLFITSYGAKTDPELSSASSSQARIPAYPVYLKVGDQIQALSIFLCLLCNSGALSLDPQVAAHLQLQCWGGGLAAANQPI